MSMNGNYVRGRTTMQPTNINPNQGNWWGDAMAMGATGVGAYNRFTDPLVDSVTGGLRRSVGLPANFDVIKDVKGLGGRTVMPPTHWAQKGVGRLANNPIFRGSVRALPAIGAIAGLQSVGQLVTGPESAANKGMDAAFMAGGAWKGALAGAAAGSVVPGVGNVVGAIGGGLAGAGGGSMASNGLQWLLGDKKSPEQHRMELALLQLNGGVV